MVLPVRERAELLELLFRRRRPAPASVVFASAYCLSTPSLPFMYIWTIESLGAKRVQFGPMVEVLEGIVRAVVGAPAHEDEQVPAVVEILLEELAGGRNVLGQQLTSHLGPLWRRHR